MASRSSPPAALTPLRAGDGRAKYLERRRLPARVDACKFGSASLLALADELGVSNGQIGEMFGGEKAGAEIRHGSSPVTPEEAILLFPLRLAAAHTIELWKQRILREAANDNGETAALRLSLALTHLDALHALLVDGHEG